MTSESAMFSRTYRELFSKLDREEIKKFLSTENFDINRKDSDCNAALHSAVVVGDLELVEFILSFPEANINIKSDDYEFTPLMIAAQKNYPEILKYLLEKGADLKIVNCEGVTTLMFAAVKGAVECIDVLLDHKDCNVNAVNKYNLNALIAGIDYPEVVERLINLTDLSVESIEGLNAFNFACKSDSGSIEVIQMLLEKYPFDVNKKDIDGENAIMHAISTNNFHLIEYLTGKGASLSQFNDQGACGYHYIVIFDESETYFDDEHHELPEPFMLVAIEEAARYNRIKTIKKFISIVLSSESFGKAEIAASFGLAIKFAFYSGNLEIVKILIATNLISDEDLVLSFNDILLGSSKNSLACFKYLYDLIPKENIKIDIENLFENVFVKRLYESCKIILNNFDIDLNYTNYLMYASCFGEFELVKLLVEKGADVNHIRSDIKQTALFSAASKNHLEIVKYLLEHDADPTIVNISGASPLFISAFNGNFEIFSAILEKDKNINLKVNDGSCVFLAACTSGDFEIIKTLVEMGADINSIESDKNNCFHLIAKNISNLDSFIYLIGNVDNLDKMLNDVNIEGQTPLDCIIEHVDFRVTVLSKLLEAKPELRKYFDFIDEFSIENKENKGTCLICKEEFEVEDKAIKLPCGHEFHKICFENCSNINFTCPHCKSLPYVVKILRDSIPFEKHVRIFLQENPEKIKQLVSSKNFDINSTDSDGITVLHIAAFSNNVEVMKFILREPNVNINSKTFDSKATPLLYAAENGGFEALKYLIEQGADLRTSNNEGFTALMLAVTSNSIECVDELLKHENCDVNAQNSSGLNALMIGIENIEMVRRLIDRTDLSHETKGGLTAFHYACYAGLLEVVQLMLAKNVVDVNKPDRSGKTPMELAFTRCNMDVMNCLHQYGASMPGTVSFVKIGGNSGPEVIYREYPPQNIPNYGGPQTFHPQGLHPYHPSPVFDTKSPDTGCCNIS
jgi:ankyrin repeat protein